MSQEVHPDTVRATRGGARVPSFDPEVMARVPHPSVAPDTAPTESKTESRKARQSRPPKVKPEAPYGVPLPKSGMSKLQYALRKYLGHADRVPDLNDKDLEDWLDVKIRFLVHHMKITVVTVNSIGGSGKTTHTLGLSSFASKNSGLNVAAMPATRNTTTSATAVKAGISPSKTVTVSQLYHMITTGQLKDYRDISARIPRTKEADLFIVSEDTAETKTEYGAEELDTNAAFLERVCDALFLDTGNDTIEEQAILYKAAIRADVIVFTANVNNALSLTKLVEEMSNLMRLPSHEGVITDPKAVRAAAQVSITEKAQNGIVLFGSMRSRESVESFRPFTMRRGGKRQERSSIGFNGQILGVPWDPYLKTPIVTEDTVEEIDDKIVIRPNKLRRQTRIALKLALVAIYEQAAATRRTPIEWDVEELLKHYYGN